MTATVQAAAYDESIGRIAELLKTPADRVLAELEELARIYDAGSSVAADIAADFAHQAATCLRRAQSTGDKAIRDHLAHTAAERVADLRYLY